MSARDRKLILIALLFTVAGGAIYWQFFGGALTVAGPGVNGPGVAIPPPDRINGQMMASSDGSGGAERNPFGFGREVVTAAPPPAIVIPPPPPPPPPPVIDRRPTQPTTPTVAAAPNIPLTYTGYARDDANEMIAFLESAAAAGIPAGHYNLREDDFLLGRYRVSKITPESVEVEDQERPESNRKQTIAISAPLAVRR